jgi:hypothetical protein
MSNKSREVIFGSRIRGAKIRAEGAREEAVGAVRAADRAEAEAWSIRMEGTASPRSRRRRSRNASMAANREKTAALQAWQASYAAMVSKKNEEIHV